MNHPTDGTYERRHVRTTPEEPDQSTRPSPSMCPNPILNPRPRLSPSFPSPSLIPTSHVSAPWSHDLFPGFRDAM